MNRERVTSFLTNLAVIGAGFLLFYSRPYVDLLPVHVPHHWLPGLPPLVPPLLLFAAFLVWLFLRTKGNRARFLAGAMAFLPVLLTLSVPVIPDLLFDKQWFIVTCALFVLSPVFFSVVDPGISGLGRKCVFVVSAWLWSFSFVMLVFLLMIRANALPLSAAVALVAVFSAAVCAFSGGKMRGISKFLPVAGVLPLLAVVLPIFYDGQVKQPVSKESRVRHETLITAGPYLQNMQKNSVTICWETTEALPGKVIAGRKLTSLLDGENELPEKEGPPYESPEAKIHEVTVNGLTEDSTYYYRVVSNGITDEISSFRTAYEGPNPFDFVVYGDSQEMFGWVEYLVRNRHKEMCGSILSHSPQARFLVHVGDMTFLGNDHERWRREFFGRARDLMRNTVVWPVIGNHELNAAWYFDYFSVPNEDEHYYYFDYGNSRFIVLAVEGYAVGHEFGPPDRTPMEPGSPQYEWLVKTLESSQDKAWRFVFFHQLPYASGLEGGYTPAQTLFVPLFERYHVNTVFGGHDHAYELSIKEGILYVVTGGGGGVVSPLQPDLRHNPYSRYFKGIWHHCRVHVEQEVFEIQAVDLKGRVFHSVKVGKDRKIIL